MNKAFEHAPKAYCIPSWYVVHTHLRQESRVQSNLCSWRVETLNPKVQDRRYNPFSGRPVIMVKSLFPQYIFARFKANELLPKIRLTRGVHSIVSFGSGPVPISEELIDLLKSRIDADGFVKFGEVINPGDEVRIKNGPLRNFTGVFERGAKSAERVIILLNTVSYGPRITIEKTLIEKLTLRSGA
jgi:transcriptional antiterminator RfaH